jgi:uncharacterized membrane protein YbhN (UPF0104 family)
VALLSICGKSAPQQGPDRERSPDVPAPPQLNTLAFPTLAAIAIFTFIVSIHEMLLDRFGEAFGGLATASPAQLWLAAGTFLGVIVATGCAWRAGIQACGGKLGVADASARYAVGSLVNAVAPGGVGGPVRIALFSRALDARERVWTTAGVATTIGLARTPALAILVIAAAAIAGFPLWPLLILSGAMVAAVGVALIARHRTPHARVAHVLDAFRALARSPRAAVSLVGWVTAATGMRLVAAATIAAAFDVRSPVAAAVVMLPALAISGAVPLTPGNLGVGSGAIAVALLMVGVDGGTAIAIGFAFQGVETCIGVLAGACGVLALAAPPVPAWSLRLAGVTGALVAAAAFGATVLDLGV